MRSRVRRTISNTCFDLMARHDRLPGLRGRMDLVDAFLGRSRDRIVAHQDQAARDLVAHAYANVPYYRRVMEERGLAPKDVRGVADLPQLPYLTKDIIRANYDDLFAGNIAPGDRHTSATGGTTGVRMEFARDNSCLLPKEAALLNFARWAGWSIGEPLGIVWPAQMDFGEPPSRLGRVKNRLYRRVFRLEAHVMDAGIMTQMAARIRRQQPKVLRGFVSPLYQLASFILVRGLEVRSPVGVISTGEPLQQRQRQTIAKAFGCPVYDSYRSRELGPVGQECGAGKGMHVNDHGLYLESAEPERGASVGELVATDFYNYGMPFIRYRTGDYGRLDTAACACGRGTTRILEVAGRVFESFPTRDGRIIHTSALVLDLVDEAPEPMGQIQVVQTGYEEFVISFTPEPPLSADLQRYMTARLARIFGAGTRVEFREVPAILPGPSGKVAFTRTSLRD